MRKEYPTQAEIKAVLNYDPKTGLFTWKERAEGFWPKGKHQSMNCITWNSQYAGKVAGTTSSPYVNINLNKRNLRAHRLAWIYVHGDSPFGDLDHINRNKKDNRIDNLRLATRTENLRNYLLCKNNLSGVRGVTWNKQNFRWEAHIRVNGFSYHLGNFQDFDDAVKARYEAEVKYGFTDSLPNSTAHRYLQEATQ